MAHHITIIILYIYMVIMVELNLEIDVGKNPKQIRTALD